VSVHTLELAYQLCSEVSRFGKYLPDVKVKVFFGGIPVGEHRKVLETEGQPHIVVGTPGRTLQLVNEKMLTLGKLKRFVLDECDEMLGIDALGCAEHLPTDADGEAGHAAVRDAQQRRPNSHKNPLEIYVDDESKLTLGARPAAVLRQAHRGAEEPQALRAPRRSRVQPSGELRLQRAPLFRGRKVTNCCRRAVPASSHASLLQ